MDHDRHICRSPFFSFEIFQVSRGFSFVWVSLAEFALIVGLSLSTNVPHLRISPRDLSTPIPFYESALALLSWHRIGSPTLDLYDHDDVFK
jgi:hypothetical protein